MTAAERAKAYFLQGYNCAQAVAGAFQEEMGLPLDMTMRLASSFGGGMGGLRETCGALTGGFLVLGAVLGYDDPAAQKEKTKHYARVRDLAEAFATKEGTCVCRELLASLPGKLSQDPRPRTEAYYKERPCVRFVEEAATLVETMLQQAKGANTR